MTLTLELPVVPITISTQGVALVRGTRVPIDTVIIAFEQGNTPEEIAQDFPTVTVADAYAVIGYYLQHQAVIDAYMAERREQRGALRARVEQQFDPHGLRALAGPRGGIRAAPMKLLADENFYRTIARGLLRQQLDIDLVQMQDVGLGSADDPAVHAWVAAEDRLVLTHDAETLSADAYARVRAGLPMPGVIEVSQEEPIGAVITDLLLLIACSLPGEIEGQVLYLSFS